MAVRFYDEAMCRKLNSWIKDPNMVILKPDETSRLFSIKADQNNDKPLSLPMIALSRKNEIELDYPHKKPMTFDGLTLKSSENYSIVINAIPMKLQYQLDIYTRYSEEGDEYLRNFIFNFINMPALEIELPYNDIWLPHRASIDLASTVTDTSDIPQRLIEDQFTRWTLDLQIKDAYLFSLPKKDNVELVIDGLQVDDLTSETEKL